MSNKCCMKLRSITAILIIVAVTAALFSAFPARSEAFNQRGVINNGVYSLKNKYTGTYLDIEADSYHTDKHIQVYNYGSDPNSESTRSGLFKFINKESDKYVIRTMRNNANSFYRASSTAVLTKSINTNDSSVDDSDCWYVTSAGSENGHNYYYLKYGNVDEYLCAPVSGKFCTTESSGNGGDRAKWELIPYNGNTIIGAKVNYLEPQVISMGSSILIHPNYLEQVYFYSTVLGENTFGSYVGFQALSPSNGQTSNIAEVSGNFLVNKPNKAGMTAVAIEYSNVIAEPFNVYIKPTNDTYFFLENIQSVVGFVESNGTYSSKANFDYDDNQIWRKIDADNGYYYIQNMDGNYLTAPDSTSTYVDIGLESSLLPAADRDRQRWKFENARTGSNAKKIKAASEENYDLWLNINPNNNHLMQETFVNDNSYYDEFNVVALGSDVVYLRTFSTFTDINLSQVVKNLCNHYDGFELIHLKNQLGNHENGSIACYKIALDMLENSKVMVFSGHADPTKITISDYNQHYHLTRGHLLNSYVDLSTVDIIIFDGCSTAGTPTSGFNLIEAAYATGAKVAIGWKNTVYADNQMIWINSFFEHLNIKKEGTERLLTAYEAFSIVTLSTYNSSNSADICGTDTSFSFN